MAKITISFTIDEDQLQAVDALAENTRLNRSAMLGVLIDAGMTQIKRPANVLTDRDTLRMYATQVATARPLPVGAFPGADADQVEA